jgi:hypothetical protein
MFTRWLNSWDFSIHYPGSPRRSRRHQEVISSQLTGHFPIR